ncbi:hypothetical protein GIY23_07055 [Allosaccharopolyspora coralli]|uniref:Uncharacterized protein n=1 Tax=Allosaccharopolyspora coralli TaxID=2665642 RepID=A0A5Q3Q3Y2_9PSEU|nr:hypothetical protein [Allosaccharopolyspora coralli]QGK69321.1 hypothetical protein GIY23_07055 [Allosaccharopolyspora coralli]
MTSSPEAPETAPATPGTDSLLHELIGRGFQFLHPCDEHGEVVAVVGVRAHHDVVDVLRLHSEDDAVATRIPGDEENILAPSRMAWQSTGTAVHVLGDLLSLPDQHTPGLADPQQPSAAARGCWVPGGPGRAKWLAATA